jgi:hypothetical protein
MVGTIGLRGSALRRREDGFGRDDAARRPSSPERKRSVKKRRLIVVQPTAREGAAMPKTVLLVDQNPLGSLREFEAFLVERGFLAALPQEAMAALGPSRIGRIALDHRLPTMSRRR